MRTVAAGEEVYARPGAADEADCVITVAAEEVDYVRTMLGGEQQRRQLCEAGGS